jgi:hypothetical protein
VLASVTDYPRPAPKEFNFKLSPSNVSALECAPRCSEAHARVAALRLRALPLADSPLRVRPSARAARFAFVSLANNHSLDFYEEGLAETMATLKRHNIAFAGVGRAQEAAAPAFVVRAGLRLAFLSYSDHYDYWSATPEVTSLDPCPATSVCCAARPPNPPAPAPCSAPA